MVRRHELTDEQWALMKDLFSAQGRGGMWGDHRALLNGVMWRLRTGAP
jgi:transposase